MSMKKELTSGQRKRIISDIMQVMAGCSVAEAADILVEVNKQLPKQSVLDPVPYKAPVNRFKRKGST